MSILGHYVDMYDEYDGAESLDFANFRHPFAYDI